MVPYDGVAEKEIVSIHLALTVVYIFLACVGIGLAVACLIFNFKFRNSKYDIVHVAVIGGKHTLANI